LTVGTHDQRNWINYNLNIALGIEWKKSENYKSSFGFPIESSKNKTISTEQKS
jgi:hypothetical protein